jgi:hypothetical protein
MLIFQATMDDWDHKWWRNPVTIATDLWREESENVLEQLWRKPAKVACLDAEVRISSSLGYLQDKPHMQIHPQKAS